MSVAVENTQARSVRLPMRTTGRNGLIPHRARVGRTDAHYLPPPSVVFGRKRGGGGTSARDDGATTATVQNVTTNGREEKGDCEAHALCTGPEGELSPPQEHTYARAAHQNRRRAGVATTEIKHTATTAPLPSLTRGHGAWHPALPGRVARHSSNGRLTARGSPSPPTGYGKRTGTGKKGRRKKNVQCPTSPSSATRKRMAAALRRQLHSGSSTAAKQPPALLHAPASVSRPPLPPYTAADATLPGSSWHQRGLHTYLPTPTSHTPHPRPALGVRP